MQIPEHDCSIEPAGLIVSVTESISEIAPLIVWSDIREINE